MSIDIRTIEPHEREAVLDLLADWDGESREHFARYLAHDPTYRDDLCFVACDGDRLVSTLQVFRKRVRFGGAVLDVAGVGNVFTAASHRGQGIAGGLLDRAFTAMRQHRFDLSLLFATRLPFYSRLGWTAHPRKWIFVAAAADSAPAAAEIRPFEPADLEAVRGVYDAYCAGLDGTTVRDAGYWPGHRHTAGNLDEDFLVARAGDEIVAYVRGTRLYDLYVMTEHACLPGHAEALVSLTQQLLAGPARGEAGIVTQFAVAPDVVRRLEAAGHAIAPVDDYFWMWRVVDADSVANKLGVAADQVRAPDFWGRILPPDASVYWISDRF